MATEVIHIIDPDNGSGTDYTSLSAWEAGEQGDLTGVRDEIAVAKCRCTGGTADTTSVNISGWTTDATRYIKIWTDPAEGYRHSGKWSDTKYRIVSTNTFFIYENYLQLVGIQIHENAGISYRHGIIIQGDEVLIDSCITKGGGKALASCYGIQDDAGGATIDVIVRNTIVYDFYYGMWFYTGTTVAIQNCSICSCTTGLSKVGSASVSATNVGLHDCTTAFSGTLSQTTCSSTSPTFVDADNDDFHLASSDTTWKNQGTDLSSTFTNDIDGQTRSGTWDIGADEYVAAAASMIPPRNMRRLQHLLAR